MEQIKDHAKYTELLRNGCLDKLFFVDKIFNWKTMVDFGCGDGYFTKMIAEIFPEKRIMGYDSDPEMIQVARHTGAMPGNVVFTNQFPPEGMNVLNLTSVVHEIEHYSTEEEKERFWYYVFNAGFKYIIIRDMMWEQETPRTGVSSFSDGVVTWCRENGKTGELKRFEEMFGSIREYKNLVHFCLKYLYIDSPNWNREIAENYLSMPYADMLRKVIIYGSKYEFDYINKYTLPFLRERWRQDFGSALLVRTHVQIILRRK